MEEKVKTPPPVIAAMIAASASILAIGVFNVLAENYAGLKDFLAFSTGMGSLLGKVTFSYLLGLGVFFALFRLRALAGQRLFTWTVVLITSTAASSLLLVTPFVKLITGH